MIANNLSKKNWPCQLNIQKLILYSTNNLLLIPISLQLNHNLQHKIYNVMEFSLNFVYLGVK